MSANFTMGSCTKSLKWGIGDIDPRFRIDKKKIRQVMSEAAGLWSEASGIELLEYSDDGQLTLNFIYSEGQKFTDNQEELSSRIDDMKQDYFFKDQKYDQLTTTYEKVLKEYNQTVTEHFEKVNKYNRVSSRWGDTGVIPREEKEALKNLSKQIKLLQRELEQEREKLNAIVRKIQQLSDEMNIHADQVNKLIFRYKEQFISGNTFYQGMYIEAADQQKINIYQFENVDKLRLVLTHEIGHALGLAHVKNPKSVMYFLMEQQNEKNFKLTPEDVRAINQKCKN